MELNGSGKLFFDCSAIFILNLHTSLTKVWESSCRLKGLSHEMDLVFDDMHGQV
jgi:hypothetical protein